MHGSKKTFVLFKEIELLFNHNDIGIYIAFLQAFFTKSEFFLDKIFLIAFSLAIFFLEFPALGNLAKVHIHQANQVSLLTLKNVLFLVCISFIKTIKVELNFSYANDDMKDSSQHALYFFA